MEIASAMYSSAMDDTSLFEQFPMDFFDGLDLQSLVSDSYSCYERPNSNRKQNPHSMISPPAPRVLKTNKSASASNSLSTLISFDHSNTTHQFSNVKLETANENVLNFASLSSQGAYYEDINFVQQAQKLTNVTRNPIQAQDHVLSERRRREKLNQKFIALSSIIPGLKKMDKASVLGDAIEYVKQLKEREKILEEQVAMRTKESAVLTRKSILFADNDNSPANETPEQPLAEIEARILGKDVLIRIQCEKQNECEAKILRELQNLRLTVQSSSILPFGETTLCITIIAQMDKKHSMTAKDFVASLRKALTLLDRA